MTIAPSPGSPGQHQPRFGNWAITAPDQKDPRLRGRRYAIPFDRVWSAAMELVGGGRRWTVVKSDEIQGVIRARVVTLALRWVDDVEIRVGLDEDAQTRVDLASASRRGRWDFGTNARRIRRFLRKLDRRLDAPPELILDPGEGVRAMEGARREPPESFRGGRDEADRGPEGEDAGAAAPGDGPGTEAREPGGDPAEAADEVRQPDEGVRQPE